MSSNNELRRTIVNRRACRSCPFRRNTEVGLPPELLENTIGANLRSGYAHNCHGTNEARHPKVCAGFARFCTDNEIPNRMLDFAKGMGIFNPETDLDRSTDFELASWEAVLAMHQQRVDVVDSEQGGTK